MPERVLREFETESRAARYARSWDASRELRGLPPLGVRGDAATGKWVVIDTLRGPDGENQKTGV